MEIAIVLISIVLIYHIIKYDDILNLIVTTNEKMAANVIVLKRHQDIIKAQLLITELVMGHTIYSIVKDYIETQIEVEDDKSALMVQLEEIVELYKINRKTEL